MSLSTSIKNGSRIAGLPGFGLHSICKHKGRFKGLWPTYPMQVLVVVTITEISSSLCDLFSILIHVGDVGNH